MKIKRRKSKVEKAVESILAFREKYGAEFAKGEDSATILRKMRDERYGPDLN